jgi:hypothetical protein
MIDFCKVRLRSNPRLSLIPYDRLQAPAVKVFESLSEDPEFFGILAPPEDSVLPVKSVSRDAALLFLALREPACLPHLLNGLFGADAGERLRSLILDGVFEIELSGQFLSGAAALAQLGHREGSARTSHLTRLSTDAIAYAAALELLTVQQVAARLYLFNSAPGTPAVRRRFGNDDRPFALPNDGSEAAHLLRSLWRSETTADGWLVWSSSASACRPAYKLYISPTLEQLPRIFELAIEAFAKSRCTLFKLGEGASGLLRPDKLVAYFSTLDYLQQAADQIRTAATGAVAQGVPFTAPIDAEGLLSWGMDPPHFQQVLAWQRHQSWRQWLTERVAVYVLAAKEAGVDVDSFVRNRIDLDGVDPSTWNPDLAIWRGPAGGGQELT